MPPAAPLHQRDAFPAGDELDPEILLVIEALARANARRDYAAAEKRETA